MPSNKLELMEYRLVECDDEPSWEAVEQYARNYMQQLKKEGMSERETANSVGLLCLKPVINGDAGFIARSAD